MLPGRQSDRATILVVDDDPVTRAGLAFALEGAGLVVLEAGSAREAIGLLDKRPDLIVLDVGLPDGNGYDLCHRLKSDSATATIPILLLSSLGARSDERIHGLEIGADGYLAKPVDAGELAAEIKALLRLRHAEESLRESELRYRELFEANPHPMWVYDTETLRFLAVNDAAVSQYGFARNEFLTLTLRDVRAPEAVDSPLLAPPGAAPELQLRHTTRHRWKDGAVRDVEESSHALRYGGRPARLVLVLDVTERKKLEERFQQAQKMEAVGRLAGGIAHDFNNLLTVINGYCELVLTQLPPAFPAREPIGEILKAGERAAALTRQLLAFSRRQVLAPRVLSLNTVVVETEKMLRRVIGEDIDLATRLLPALGYVRADPGQIEQVLLNLAVNARDAMPHGGRLTIETRNVYLDVESASAPAAVAPGPYVLLAVSDTGVGMTPDVKARAFEPFFTTKGPGIGTGLGLATVHGIVTQSGGRVDVYSEPGQGTTLKILLPRVDSPLAPGRSHAGLSQVPIPQGTETILLAEDDASVRSLSRRVLEASGYRVLETAGGDETLRVAEQEKGRIDLLVSDVVMPGLGGRQLAERLRALRPELDVLFLSGYTDDAVVRHGVLEAEVNFLQKPFSPAALVLKVREILDSSAAKRVPVAQ